jgi:hypothetical protein
VDRVVARDPADVRRVAGERDVGQRSDRKRAAPVDAVRITLVADARSAGGVTTARSVTRLAG